MRKIDKKAEERYAKLRVMWSAPKEPCDPSCPWCTCPHRFDLDCRSDQSTAYAWFTCSLCGSQAFLPWTG